MCFSVLLTCSVNTGSFLSEIIGHKISEALKVSQGKHTVRSLVFVYWLQRVQTEGGPDDTGG
jgi:hypothetical protein